MSSTALVTIQPLGEAPVLVDAVAADDPKEIVTKLRNKMGSLRQEHSGEDWLKLIAVRKESHTSVATRVPQLLALFELLQDREVCWK